MGLGVMTLKGHVCVQGHLSAAAILQAKRGAEGSKTLTTPLR